ncbi:MAG TPA: gluconeogenesis factor YvcK family protein [Acidimicrobiales bacterium]|nr:gluconeogenesis factor YvcK family protein [Acidimicrobiales bacterium]
MSEPGDEHDGGRRPRVVALGGGHGLAATLRSVRTLTDAVTAVVSVADDGGSSGRLRELMHILPPGDLRKCLVALAEPDSLLASAFAYRFNEGELSGHSLGNLMLARLMEAAGDPISGLDEAARLLGVRGRVLPATTELVVLKAETEGGPVSGQVAVMGNDRIERVSLVPDDAVAPGPVIEAIRSADLIVLGPGSLFTSVLAAVAVPGITDAIQASPGRTVYVCNLRPQIPETAGFDLGMHISALVAHGVDADVAVYDPSGLAPGNPSIPVIEASLCRPNGLAHDPTKLANVLSDLLG